MSVLGKQELGGEDVRYSFGLVPPVGVTDRRAERCPRRRRSEHNFHTGVLVRSAFLPERPASAARPSSLPSAGLEQRLGRTGRPEAAEGRPSLALTEFMGTPGPECSPLRIAAPTAQASALEKRGVVGHRHAHRRATVARVGGTLEEEPGRSDVARSEEGVAAHHQSGDLGSGEPRPVRHRL